MSFVNIFQSFQAVTMTPSTHFTLCFTLLNADPNSTQISWNFQSAFESTYYTDTIKLLDYLQPFLETVSPLAHFTVISQVLHYGKLLQQPLWAKAASAYYIPEQELPLFINPHQWALGISSDLLPFRFTRFDRHFNRRTSG